MNIAKGAFVRAATALSVLTAGATSGAVATGCDRVQPRPMALPKLENADPHTQAEIDRIVTEFARRCLELGQSADLSPLIKERNALGTNVAKDVTMWCKSVTAGDDNVAVITIGGKTVSTRRSPEAKKAVDEKGPIANERVEWLGTVSD